MEQFQVDIHPNLRINGIQVGLDALTEVAYSLIKEGLEYDKPVGDFILDWLSPEPYVEVKTSGSTGIPKTIRLFKEHMIQSALNIRAFFNVDDECRALLCLPAHTVAGKMMLVRAMVHGWDIDIVEPSSTPLLGHTKSYDFGAMVPLQLRKSLADIDRIKTLIVGGGHLAEDLKAALQKKEVKVYETFGMTETASQIAIKPVNTTEAPYEHEGRDVFITLPGIGISQDDRGCLIVDAPKLTTTTVVTNDLVEIVSENSFKWLGRWDNVINSGGVKLIPEVLEQKLTNLMDNRFVLLGLPDQNLGEKLVMVVEGTIDTGSLSDEIDKLDTIHAYEKPKQIFMLEKFPENQGGKIKRPEILAQLI